MIARLIALLVAALLAALPAHAQGGQRIALVIGNAAYNAQVGRLDNPGRDADLVAAALRSRGFAVTVVKDAGRVTLQQAVDRYARALGQAGSGAVGFFYYSGHGVANPENGRNYVVPVDAASAADDRLWYESIELQQLVRSITTSAGQATNIVVFDACREVLALPKGKGLGSGGKGLERIAGLPSTLIAFSTSPGALAADRDKTAATGPYATELAKALGNSSLDAAGLFQRVKFGVLQRTGGKQQPWIEDGLSQEVWFGTPAPTVATSVATAPAVTTPVPAPSTASAATTPVRGYIGVSVQPLAADLANAVGRDPGKGELIARLEPGGPAIRGGVQPGDVVTAVDGIELTSGTTLSFLIAQRKPGATAQLGIIRAGAFITLPVTVGARPSEDALAAGAEAADTSPTQGPASSGGNYKSRDLGFDLIPITDKIASQLGVGAKASGLVISTVDTAGPNAGTLQRGDLIESINQIKIGSGDGLAAEIGKARAAGRKAVLAFVRRGKQATYVALKLR